MTQLKTSNAAYIFFKQYNLNVASSSTWRQMLEQRINFSKPQAGKLNQYQLKQIIWRALKVLKLRICRQYNLRMRNSPLCTYDIDGVLFIPTPPEVDYWTKLGVISMARLCLSLNLSLDWKFPKVRVWFYGNPESTSHNLNFSVRITVELGNSH